ncbi:MAG TPA: hypothetical protein DEO71_11910 [Chryseobacterium sp.]|nr:hypothetical protein [Chryseobacterium sp.]
MLSYKAQQTYPLSVSDYDASSNSYFKDTNNELDFYIGTWNADFQEKKISLIISKEIKRPYKAWNKDFFQDILLVRYEVKDSFGNILQSTRNDSFSVGSSTKNIIISAALNLNGNNEVNLIYAGGNCSVGKGEITLKKNNNTQLFWSYYPGTVTINDATCPPNLDYKIYLPETEDLIFTKQ